MGPLVYNNDIVSNHSLYSHCASTLNVVSERDYPGENYFDPRIACLDMDTYEASIRHGNLDNTTDAVIGISTCINRRMSQHRLMLVELRMLYGSANGLRRGDLERKVTHTRDLLGGELTIEDENIFVFPDGVAPQAIHKINSWKREGGLAKYFFAWSVSAFRQSIKSIDDMPYTPIYDPVQLCNELDGFAAGGQWKELFDKIHFWLNMAEKVRYSNSFEYESLQKTVMGWWQQFSAQHIMWSNEDDELDAMIIDDDIRRVF